MAKILFLLNESPPNREKYYCKDPITVSNFVYPNSMVLKDMGIEQYMGISRKYATSIECVNAPIKFLDIPIYRNIFDVKNILIAYIRINKYLKKLQIDYIHCNTPIGGFLGRVCGKRSKLKKIIYTAHGFHFYKGAPFINWLLFYPIERFLARWTDVLITMNEEDYRRAKRFKLRTNGKIYKINGIGIDLSQINKKCGNHEKLYSELGLKNDCIIVISVGDLNKNKNNIMVIDALAKLRNPRINYVICGVGPKYNYLQKKVKKYGLEQQVHFLGFRNNIIELLKTSDIFILPSRREGLPRSLMEAMACGLPCIANRIRGAEDLISHGVNGFLCEKKNLVDFIQILIQDQLLAEAFSIQSTLIIKDFDVLKIIESLRRIYLLFSE